MYGAVLCILLTWTGTHTHDFPLSLLYSIVLFLYCLPPSKYPTVLCYWYSSATYQLLENLKLEWLELFGSLLSLWSYCCLHSFFTFTLPLPSTATDCQPAFARLVVDPLCRARTLLLGVPFSVWVCDFFFIFSFSSAPNCNPLLSLLSVRAVVLPLLSLSCSLSRSLFFALFLYFSFSLFPFSFLF